MNLTSAILIGCVRPAPMQAVQAVNTLNGTELGGRKILVREDREDRDVKQYNRDNGLDAPEVSWTPDTCWMAFAGRLPDRGQATGRVRSGLSKACSCAGCSVLGSTHACSRPMRRKGPGNGGCNSVCMLTGSQISVCHALRSRAICDPSVHQMKRRALGGSRAHAVSGGREARARVRRAAAEAAAAAAAATSSSSPSSSRAPARAAACRLVYSPNDGPHGVVCEVSRLWLGMERWLATHVQRQTCYICT